jgi:LuxR family maltose regulon positive regulatory protein
MQPEGERGASNISKSPHPTLGASALRTRSRAPRSVGSLADPNFAVFEAKIRRPTLRPGVVTRSALLKRLRRNDAPQAVLVTAPAGYGKTTLLAQWAATEARPVAWVSIDARDSEPVVFLRHVAAAVTRVEALDPRVFASLRRPTEAAWDAIARRCLRAVASCSEPYLLVLDNVDLLRSSESRRLLSAVLEQVGEGSTIALAARVMPKLRIAGLRAGGALEEIGVDELAFSSREAQLLLQAAYPEIGEGETAELVERCEGWPAALYLGALSLRDRTPASVPRGRFGGSDRFLADYLRTEYVSHLHPRDLRFLRRTSVLGAMSGPLCDSVLQTDDSERVLEKIARANLLVQLERGRGWFRVHHLFRDLLLRDLTEVEPQLIRTLHHRAADWYEARGELETALEHADAAGDMDRVAATVATTAFALSCRGGTSTLERWLERFDAAGLERYPALAVHGSRIHALQGRAAEAERWLTAAERGIHRHRDAVALRPMIAVVRAAICRRGARQMLLDANTALRELPRTSDWRPTALLLRGCAALLLGAGEGADSLLADATKEAAAHGFSETRMIGTSERSLFARRRGDHDLADELSEEAREIAARDGLESYPTFGLALAAAAHTSLRHGRWAEARELLTAADRSRPSLTEALPWLGVGVRIELARCYLTLRDLDAVRGLTRELEAILVLRPQLGVLGERARELQQQVRALTVVEENARLGLTPAELRLLPLLATHLSFREIAEQLKLSRNTVKTQAISIYRKLGASGRSDAVTAAALLDPTRGVA